MSRFNKETLPIRDLCPTVLLRTLVKGLRGGPFVDSLARGAPDNIDELRCRVTEYINMEEISRSGQNDPYE